MDKYSQLISTAQRLLLESPFDLGHDGYHHYSVWQNALIIIKQEGLQPNMNKLEAAIWWHDYDRTTGKHERLVQEMQELGFTTAEITDILSIINSHSFTDKRSARLESTILFDADKIEYVNPGRWFWAGEAVHRGQMTPEVARNYGLALEKRLAKVVETLHYPAARKLFRQQLALYIDVSSSLRASYGDMMADVRNETLAAALIALDNSLNVADD